MDKNDKELLKLIPFLENLITYVSHTLWENNNKYNIKLNYFMFQNEDVRPHICNRFHSDYAIQLNNCERIDDDHQYSWPFCLLMLLLFDRDEVQCSLSVLFPRFQLVHVNFLVVLVLMFSYVRNSYYYAPFITVTHREPHCFSLFIYYDYIFALVPYLALIKS